jgi:hypothetical protein
MAVIDEMTRQRTAMYDQLVNVHPVMTAHLRQHMREGTPGLSTCALYQGMMLPYGDSAAVSDKSAAVADEKAPVDEHAGHQH